MVWLIHRYLNPKIILKFSVQPFFFSQGSPASTVLCFMVKSLAGQYSDVVAMFPMSNLTVKKLEECFMLAFKLSLDSGFRVILTVADNHKVNRQFFKDCLCEGELKPLARNPLNHSLPLFVLIDPTHTIKNIYNNWQKSSGFVIPAVGSLGPYSPKFIHVKQLYEMESSKSLRMAHKLTPTCLQPTNIQRTSSKLAFNVFDESTANAMLYYSRHERPEWEGTARFINDMCVLLKVINVKHQNAGVSLRDDLRKPLTSSDDDKLGLLKSYENLFRVWKAAKTPGLTSETSTACILMCETLPAFAKQLFCFGFRFVLLGHTQTDELEHRFGRYRQMSGANYFISVKQLLQSEKKLKITSLLRHTKMSPLDLSTISSDECIENYDCMLLESEEFNLDEIEFGLDVSELEVLCFVGGYVASVISKRSSCESCCVMLVVSDALPGVEADHHSHFLSIVNRGGLKKPSDNLFILCCCAYSVFAHLKNSDTFSKFLTHPQPACLFYSIVNNSLLSSDFAHVLQFNCKSLHNLAPRILRCMFNILAKNFVRSIPSGASFKNSKKVKKLQSTSF